MTDEELKRERELQKQDRIEARAAERKKIRELMGKQKLQYLWDYYKFVLVILAVVLVILYVIVNMVIGANTETLLYTCLINVDALETDDELLEEDFANSIGGLKRNQEVVFDTSMRIDPDSSGTSQSDVANTMKMTAYLQGQLLDVCIAPEEAVQYLQEQGMLLELDDLLDRDRKAEYTAGGYLYEAPMTLYDEETGLLIPPETEADASEAEENGREYRIYAVRVDQSGVLERYGMYQGEEVWFSVIGNTEHMDTALKLLDFLTGETG